MEAGMGVTRIAVVVSVLGLVWPGTAWCFLGNYGREHPAECASMRDFSDDARAACATRQWCAMQKEQDRTSYMACDPMHSRADLRKPRLVLETASLGANLPDRDQRLPTGMKTARLALKADISYHLQPTISVRLGIASADSATLAVSWKKGIAGAGTVRSIALTPQEISRLVAALNASDFWRLPYLPLHLPLHQGYVDGETARVSVATAARRHTVEDAIGDSDAVDLSILVNALSEIAQKHWPDAPTGR
jgi:hypothetical protein